MSDSATAESVKDTSSSGDETEDYEYTGKKNENEDSDLEVYFINENEYLHIPNI